MGRIKIIPPKSQLFGTDELVDAWNEFSWLIFSPITDVGLMIVLDHRSDISGSITH